MDRVSLYRSNQSLLILNEQKRLHEGEDAPRCSPAQTQSDPEGYRQKDQGGPPPHPFPPQRQRSWFKTRNVIVVAAIVILVVLGAVIGGTVEGMRRINSDKNSGGSTVTVTSTISQTSTSVASTSWQSRALVPRRRRPAARPMPRRFPRVLSQLASLYQLARASLVH